jgi:hypothetical protein
VAPAESKPATSKQFHYRSALRTRRASVPRAQMTATAPSTIGPTILHPGPTRAMTDSAVHADKFKSKRPPAFWRHATLPVLMALAPHPAALRSLHYVHVERVTDLLERMYISLFCVRRSAQVLTRSTRFAKLCRLRRGGRRPSAEANVIFASGLYLM